MADAAQPLDGEPAARVLVAGASGFAGALAADIVWRHPQLELVRVDRARRRRHAARRPLSALPRPARADRARPRLGCLHRRLRRGNRRLSARRIGAGRRRRCGSGDCSSSTSPPTSGSAIPTSTRSGTASPPTAGAARRCGLRAAGAQPRADPRAPSSSPIPAATRPPRSSALAPLAAAGLIDDVVIDAKSGVSGAGRGGGDKLHFVTARPRTPRPMAPPGTATSRRSSQELGTLAGADDPEPHLRPAPAAAGSGGARLLLRAADPRRRCRGAARALRGPL